MVLTAKGPKISAVYPPILFTATPTNGAAPLQVQFHAPSVDVFTNLTAWSWTFGDGAVSTLQSPSHTYTNVGIFTPTLLATNANNTVVLGLGPNISAGYQAVYTFGTVSGGHDPSLPSSLTNSDGANPIAGLVLSSNRLYGVMSRGGNRGSGTIFAVNTDGSGFTNLHIFSPLDSMWYTNADGAWPQARLAISGRTLFGAASTGGTNMMGGTVFRINTDGSGFTNLHYFSSSDNNGESPNGLVVSGNRLYGTARNGGSNYNGTIFALNTDGSGFGVIHTAPAKVPAAR